MLTGFYFSLPGGGHEDGYITYLLHFLGVVADKVFQTVGILQQCLHTHHALE